MPTYSEMALRKAAAAATIRDNADALAGITGATPVDFHAALTADDPQTVELLEIVAQLVAAVVELSTP